MLNNLSITHCWKSSRLHVPQLSLRKADKFMSKFCIYTWSAQKLQSMWQKTNHNGFKERFLSHGQHCKIWPGTLYYFKCCFFLKHQLVVGRTWNSIHLTMLNILLWELSCQPALIALYFGLIPVARSKDDNKGIQKNTCESKWFQGTWLL